MAVTPRRVQSLALALPDATAVPHFDRIAFRTPRRMFATLASDSSDLNLMFDLDQQEYFCKLAPHAFQALDNGWGRKGATRCDLKQANVNLLRAALETAHARANEPLKRPRATRARR